jgi:hypothetical protein
VPTDYALIAWMAFKLQGAAPVECPCVASQIE